MTCSNFKFLLHDYFLERLTPAQMDAFEAHAGECADCGSLLALARELSCREFIEFLNDYVDGALTSERRAVFERHLGLCEDCRRYVDAYAKTMRLSALAFEVSPPVERIPAELVRAILDARARLEHEG